MGSAVLKQLAKQHRANTSAYYLVNLLILSASDSTGRQQIILEVIFFYQPNVDTRKRLFSGRKIDSKRLCNNVMKQTTKFLD